jgi:hypothetical protein
MTDIFAKTLDQFMGKNRNAVASKTDFEKEHFTSPEVAFLDSGMQVCIGVILPS